MPHGLQIGILPVSDPFDNNLGDSVAVNGVCLTLESVEQRVMRFTAVLETVERTTLKECTVGDAVNLERALRPLDRMGGHFVMGHVDAIGTIERDQTAGQSVLRTIRLPASLGPFTAIKGSITIDGVSLTIADRSSESVTIALVPFTLSHSSMGAKRPGDRVNVEVDVLARYITHFMSSTDPGNNGAKTGPDLLHKLTSLGF